MKNNLGNIKQGNNIFKISTRWFKKYTSQLKSHNIKKKNLIR